MFFKKMRLSSKLYTGFGVILAILLVVSIVAWIEFNTASQGFHDYRGLARDTNLAGRLQANMLMVRLNVKDFIITASDKDRQEYADYVKEMQRFLEEAKKEIQNPQRAAMIKEVAGSVGAYEEGFEKVVVLQNQRNELVNGVLNLKGPEMEQFLSQVMKSAFKDNDAEAAYYAGEALRSLLLARLYVIKFLDDNSKPSAQRAQKEFSDFRKGVEELKARIENPRRKELIAEVDSRDEVYEEAFGKLTSAVWSRNEIITNTLDKIGPKIAGLVEDIKLSVKAAQDELGPRLQASNQQAVLIISTLALVALLIGFLLTWLITRSITKPIKNVVVGLSDSASQVASAASQVANSGQSLAEGASQQAASLEETSSSMEEMSSMTKQNADNAQQADRLSKEAREIVDQANAAMQELTKSMSEITQAGEETGLIIKTIDEIAFQTNLLALNAAVEAARAGEAGAGFAVVADEVRNLAMRAAEAAKNTANLIEGTIVKTKHGSELVEKTNAAFSEVAASTSKVGELVGEIAAASSEQAKGIVEVNQAMGEMDKVTQLNAANAEESAAAGEELSAQSESMLGYVFDLASIVGISSNGGNGKKKIGYSTQPGAKNAAQGMSGSGQLRSDKIRSKAMISGKAIPFADDPDFRNF